MENAANQSYRSTFFKSLKESPDDALLDETNDTIKLTEDFYSFAFYAFYLDDDEEEDNLHEREKAMNGINCKIRDSLTESF